MLGRRIRWGVAGIVLALAVACGKGPAPTGTAPSAAPSIPAASDERMNMEGQGVDLWLLDSHPTADGQNRKPTFRVHADGFSLAEDDIWSLEQARAVIFGRDENAPEIQLVAGRGRFQQGKMAYLKDGVDVTVGEMRMTLSDIEWLNDERVARTDSPLTITTPDSHLEAASMRMYPDRRQVELTRVTGLIHLEGEQP